MSREARAALRRTQWAQGLARGPEATDLDPAFWRHATAAQRLEAVWQMAEQWWKNEHPDGPPLRLDRSAFGIRSFQPILDESPFGPVEAASKASVSRD